MNLYEHTIIAKQSFSKSQMESLKEKYSNLIEKNSGEIIKIEDWGLINMAYQIDNNKNLSFTWRILLSFKAK